MRSENFRESDIPYKDFEKIGYGREKILAMGKEDLEQLLSGKRTSLKPISNIEGISANLNIQAKFSLERKRDGTVVLKVHPVREQINNDIKLSVHELNKVKDGNIITKKIDGERYLVQLDKENNELLKVKEKDIMIPTHVGNIELSNSQREHLKQGNQIILESQEYKFSVGINLNSRSGLKIENLKDLELKEKMAFDMANRGVIGFVQTDQNRNEYMEELHKTQNKIK